MSREPETSDFPLGAKATSVAATAVSPISCSGRMALRSTWRGSQKNGSPLSVYICISTWAVGTCAQGTFASEPGTAVEIYQQYLATGLSPQLSRKVAGYGRRPDAAFRTKKAVNGGGQCRFRFRLLPSAAASD